MGAQTAEAYGEYVEAWRQRLARQERQRLQLARHLRAIAQACAERLVGDFGAKRVYLFGSLVDEGLVHLSSDIDMAVVGLEGSLYFEALHELWGMLPAGVELDLVVLESAWPGLAERIRREGVLLDAAQ